MMMESITTSTGHWLGAHLAPNTHTPIHPLPPLTTSMCVCVTLPSHYSGISCSSPLEKRSRLRREESRREKIGSEAVLTLSVPEEGPLIHSPPPPVKGLKAHAHFIVNPVSQP
ncbi:hypothetical protein FKM82_031244 [Ascaphus truei]